MSPRRKKAVADVPNEAEQSLGHARKDSAGGVETVDLVAKRPGGVVEDARRLQDRLTSASLLGEYRSR